MAKLRADLGVLVLVVGERVVDGARLMQLLHASARQLRRAPEADVTSTVTIDPNGAVFEPRLRHDDRCTVSATVAGGSSYAPPMS